MKLCTLCIKSELLGHRQTCEVSETWLVSTVGPQTFLHWSCMSSWNLKLAIQHVEHRWTREHRLYLLNSSSNLLVIGYFQFSLLIVMPYNRTNDVVVSFVWTVGPRYTLSKLSDSAAIQWINSYILLCNAMITITLVEWNSECVSSAYPTFVQLGPELCGSRKISILPQWKGLKIPGGGGGGVFSKAQIHVFSKCMKLHWNFQRGGGGGVGGGGLRKNLFRGGRYG